MIQQWPSTSKYSPVVETEQLEGLHDANEKYYDDERQPSIPMRRNHSSTPSLGFILKWILPWVISTAFFAAFSLALYFGEPTCTPSPSTSPVPSPSPSPAASSSFETGFSTDFENARSAIAVEQREFTGALMYNESTRLVDWLIDPSAPQYFGPPSQAIDDAWKNLFENEYITITDEEAAPWPTLRKLANTGHYHMEVSMFHSLHCLNAIRKELDAEYYDKVEGAGWHLHGPSGFQRTHMDHCLDQLRQAIECAGDLSPVPMFSWPGFNLALGIGQMHTCRRPDTIRQWMAERSSKQGWKAIGES